MNTSPQVVPYSFPGDHPSEWFRVRVHDTEVPVAVVPDMDPDQAQRLANRYRELPEYCWVDPRHITVHYCHFAVSGHPAVDIDVDEPVESVTVYPKRVGIQPRITGRSLHFALPVDTSRFLIIAVNALPMLCLLAETADPIMPLATRGPVIDLRQLAGSGDSIRDSTAIFQQAIRELDGTGGILHVPAGEYTSDQIEILGRRDLSIHLDPGALIRIRPSPAGENTQRSGFLIRDCANISIHGHGCLDHSSYENYRNGRNDYLHGFPGYDFYQRFEDTHSGDPFLRSPVMIMDSHDITVEGITIRNGCRYNINTRHCERVAVRDVKILAPAGSAPEQADGINVGSTQGLLVEDCFIYCNDDVFAAGHNLLPYDSTPAGDLVMQRCLGWNPRANGVRLGWALNSHLGDVRFSHCDFAGMDDSAILIHRHAQDHHHGPPLCYTSIRFEHCTFDDVGRHTQPLIKVDEACIHRLEFVDVAFDAAPAIPPEIRGQQQRPIGVLLLDGVRLGETPLASIPAPWQLENISDVVIR